MLITPNRIKNGFHKIWEHPQGSLNSSRIVHNCNLAWTAFEVVYGAKVNTLKWWQHDKEGTKKLGGAQVNSVMVKDDALVETGAAEAFEERKTFYKSRYYSLDTGEKI